MVKSLAALAVLCVVASAQDGLAERVERLERALAEERSQRDAEQEAQQKRIQELERALQKTTDTLGRAADQRNIEAAIEEYLAVRRGESADESVLGGGGAGWSSRLNIGGVVVTSFRGTDIDGSTRTNTFQVEERYARFVYRFTDEVTARYYTDGSLAEVEFVFHEWLQVNVGLVIVPFGQFNPRSFPDTFDTLSRPLLFLGDEDTFAQPENNPRALFRSIYTDSGISASGSVWQGQNQFYYAVFVTNGLVGTTDLAQGTGFSDNNENKQIGARLAYTNATMMSQGRFGFGLSWLTGKYDTRNSLSYRFYGADVLIVMDGMFRGGEGSLTIRAEYVYAPREVRLPTVGDPTATLNEANRTQGAYVLVEARVTRKWMAYVQADWMRRSAPRLTNGLVDPLNSADIETNLYRYSAGLVHKFEFGITWKLEYAYWDFDDGAPDAHRFSSQLVIPF